jgi:hypothetical protein
MAGAREAYQENLTVARSLEAADRINPRWQRHLLIALGRVGEVLRSAGDRAGALDAYQEALAISRRLEAADPSSAERQRDVSIGIGRIGDLWRDASDEANKRLKAEDRAGAFKEHEGALSIARLLATGGPNDSEWQSNLVTSLRGVADTTNDIARKRAALQEMLRILADLEVRDALTIEQRKLRKSIQAELAKAAKIKQ